MMSNITDKQLEKIEKMIRNIPDHLHLIALEIGKHLHLSMSFVQRALDILRERQRLPARSAVNSIDLARYRKLDRLMLVTFQPDMSMATLQSMVMTTRKPAINCAVWSMPAAKMGWI
ncbi:hypothetical protein LZ626_09785 [Aeromonas allosaccharophila]|uniref:hypothetical protein n=1 Tax=Aeromonas allosaccharophila TaxID=656 RepID=UPI001F3ED40B|nr:hypothetical protein [Aeromonas allosaccharophila]MCE9848377.1 hypothetical protein [Aeromonas allosaccharophila]